MTDPRIDKPFARERRTTELPGTAPVRGASERSGTRIPPVIAAEPPPEAEPPKWAKALAARIDHAEGRILAATNTAIVDTERRLMIVANGTARADVEATRFDLMSTIGRLRKSQVAAWLIAAILGGAKATDLLLGRDISEAVEVVAVEAAETKAAELDAAHAQTAAIARDNTARIDVLESKLDRVLVALDDLVEAKQEPARVVVPRKGRAK